MERNEQDRILALAGKHGIETEWADPGDGTGRLEFCGTLAGFVSFAEAYTGFPWRRWDIYQLLEQFPFARDFVDGEPEYSGTPNSFWAFVATLKQSEGR